jgi:hypothetical protein
MTTKNETVADVLAHIRSSPVPSINEKNDWADRFEAAMSQTGPCPFCAAPVESLGRDVVPVALDTTVSIGGLNVPLSTAVERMRERAQKLQARQRILDGFVNKADPTDGGTANLLYCAAGAIEKLLGAAAVPDELTSVYMLGKIDGRRERHHQDEPTAPPAPVSVPDGWFVGYEYTTRSQGKARLVAFVPDAKPSRQLIFLHEYDVFAHYIDGRISQLMDGTCDLDIINPPTPSPTTKKDDDNG